MFKVNVSDIVSANLVTMESIIIRVSHNKNFFLKIYFVVSFFLFNFYKMWNVKEVNIIYSWLSIHSFIGLRLGSPNE